MGSYAASSKCSCKQAFLPCRYFAPLGLVRRIVEMLLQAGISPMSVLRPDGACAPHRRNAPASRHFSYVGTSPRWGLCAASSKCSCKQAFLLASDGMTEERGHAPTSSLWGSCTALPNAPASGHFSSRSDGMTGEGGCGALPYKTAKRQFLRTSLHWRMGELARQARPNRPQKRKK